MTLQRQFLRPVAALTAGLAAMRRRDFGFRLEPLADDELGRLGAAFTQALARLADLELGRALQTALAPPARLVVGGYELVAWTRMLQAVGGDYHDFVPLPADRWAVVLGDVAGHGISAALVTAMAKSAFSLLCPRHADHPEIAMAEVNRVLFDSLRKVRLMTCLLGHLDPANGHLALVGAGHPMPLRLRPDGTASEIEALGRPIGIRDNTRYTSQSVAIGDDQLLFYTDGLVECANRAGIPLGFPRFTALAGAARAATGAATIERLLAAVADYTAGADPDDDTTLVLIGRVPPPPAGARAPATATPPG